MFTSNRCLIQAIEQCQINKVVYYVEHGFNIHVCNSSGENVLVTTLKYSSKGKLTYDNRRLKLFLLLLSYNINPNMCDKNDKNVFNWACTLNCTQEALHLLKMYPGELDILKIDHSGQCSLHYTCEHGNFELIKEIVQYLLKFRIKFNIEDNDGNTPDMLAKKMGFNTIENYLKEKSKLIVHSSIDSNDEQHPPVTTFSSFIRSTIGDDYQSKHPLKTFNYYNNDIFTEPSSELNSANTFEMIGTINTRQSPSTDDWYEQLQRRIKKAKSINDWKTVASLRTLMSRISNEDELRKQMGLSALTLANQSSDNKVDTAIKKELHKTTNTTTIPPIKKNTPVSMNKRPSTVDKQFPLISTGKTSEDSLQQLLSVIEIQMSSSYQRTSDPIKRASVEQRPSLLRLRGKRESNVSLTDHPSRTSSSRYNSILSLDPASHPKSIITTKSVPNEAFLRSISCVKNFYSLLKEK